MQSLLVALIGGLFSLAGIWLKHHLETRANLPPPGSGQTANHPAPTTPEVHGQRPIVQSDAVARLAKGAISLGAVALIFLVLQTDISDALGWFLFFVGGACLMYGLVQVVLAAARSLG